METRNYSENVNRGFEKLQAHMNVLGERSKQETRQEREIVKESLQSFSNEVKDNSIDSQSPAQDPLHVLPQYVEIESEKTKEEVERIVELAANEGLEKGIQESLKYSAFIQDAVHDALVDRLIPEMKKRGILK